MSNFDLYLEKNKDVSFIVYRNFDPSLDSILAKPTAEKTGAEGEHLPKSTSETIRPVAEDLIQTIKTILESREEYADMLREYNISYELPAPYLFMYHSRKNLEDIRDSLSLPAQQQLSILSDYITEQYGHEYAAADSLLLQNKISPEYVRYLFKPGDVLVARNDGQYTAYIAASWPKPGHTRTVSRMQAKSFGNGARAEFYGSKDTPGKMPGDKVKIQVWVISAWYWAFDGNFQRQNQTLQLEIPVDEDDSAGASDTKGKGTVEKKADNDSAEPKGKNIAELNVIPIQYTSEEIVDRLRRRGRTFWNCRSRRFVSYQEHEKDDIQNLVSASRPITCILAYSCDRPRKGIWLTSRPTVVSTGKTYTGSKL